MSIAATLASQCLVMFAVMGLGCLLVKLGMLSPTTTRELGSLLLNVVFPVVIVRSFWGMYTPERLENLVFTMVLSALALGLAMLIARLVFSMSCSGHTGGGASPAPLRASACVPS